ncbi:hypothetical protein RRG08_063017 [Elysia crispata]|uniref:Uncharacterized protein n=1 Tax=Elysia crispata TaxID=231223 RepID=A0AAE0Y9U5_9GAST|nr:hypothetical protein RRG08_063017 [Elysia crispata]
MVLCGLWRQFASAIPQQSNFTVKPNLLYKDIPSPPSTWCRAGCGDSSLAPFLNNRTLLSNQTSCIKTCPEYMVLCGLWGQFASAIPQQSNFTVKPNLLYKDVASTPTTWCCAGCGDSSLAPFLNNRTLLSNQTSCIKMSRVHRVHGVVRAVGTVR